jgi:hypothetical protein
MSVTEADVIDLSIRIEELEHENKRLREVINIAHHWAQDICAGALEEFLAEAMKDGDNL